MIHYVTFGGEHWERTTAKQRDACHMLGIVHHVYDDVWMNEHPFSKSIPNQWLYKHHWPRGVNWFAFKSLIMLDCMDRLSSWGDTVIYTDADTYPVCDLSPIDDIVQRDGAFFCQAGSHVNRHWCKRDAMIVMGQDDERYLDAPAGNAGVLALRAGVWEAKQFLYEWLTFCCNHRANTLDPSVLGPEYPGFIESRADQAIMTLLAAKYGWPLHRDPSQFGNVLHREGDDYPQLFHHEPGMTKAPGPPKGSRYRNV